MVEVHRAGDHRSRLARGAAALGIALTANLLLVLALGWLNRAPAPSRPELPEVQISIARAPANREVDPPREPPPPEPQTQARVQPPLPAPPPAVVPDLRLEPLPPVAELAPRPPPRQERPAPRPDPGPRTADSVDSPPVERALRSPEYPRTARRRGLEGYVRMRLLIDRGGRVEQIEILEVDGSAAFAEAVRRVAPAWRFEPARHRGQPVPVWATKTIRFQLDRG